MIGYQIERERTELTRFVVYIGVGALLAFHVFLSVPWLLNEIGKELTITLFILVVLGAGATMYAYRRFRRKRQSAPASAMTALLAFLLLAGATHGQLPAPSTAPAVTASVVSGAIAALVVFAIFCGGMLEGGLFPKIVNNLSPATDGPPMMELITFLNETGPVKHVDYGKLLVWAFIAGFAERFVPDVLDKFTASARK